MTILARKDRCQVSPPVVGIVSSHDSKPSVGGHGMAGLKSPIGCRVFGTEGPAVAGSCPGRFAGSSPGLRLISSKAAPHTTQPLVFCWESPFFRAPGIRRQNPALWSKGFVDKPVRKPWIRVD